MGTCNLIHSYYQQLSDHELLCKLYNATVVDAWENLKVLLESVKLCFGAQSFDNRSKAHMYLLVGTMMGVCIVF